MIFLVQRSSREAVEKHGNRPHEVSLMIFVAYRVDPDRDERRDHGFHQCSTATKHRSITTPDDMLLVNNAHFSIGAATAHRQ